MSVTDLITRKRFTDETDTPVSEPGEEVLRAIAKNTSELVALYNLNGQLVYMNSAYRDLVVEYSNLHNTDPFKLVHPGDRERVRETLFNKACDGLETRMTYRLETGGECRQLTGSSYPLRDNADNVTHVLVISRDVTESSRLEETLAKLEAKLTTTQELAKLGYWERNLDTDLVTFSDQLKEILGLSPEHPNHLGYEEIFQYIRKDSRDSAAATTRNAIIREQTYELELPIVRTDGTIRIILNRAHIARDSSGQPVRIVGVVQDITEQNLAEKKSRKSEESFRLMVENALNYAFCLLDTDGNVTSWNPGAERMMGYTSEEILGKHFLCFYPPESIAASDPIRQMEHAIKQGRYETQGWRIRKDRSRFWAGVIIVPLYTENDDLYGFAKITHDLTEWKRSEEDLRSHTSRLKSLSRRLVEAQETERRHLAGELHDLIGPNLTAMGINLQLIGDSLPESLRADLSGRLDDCVTLLGTTVDALRGVIGELRPTDLDDYGLVSALRSLTQQFSRRTGIRVRIPEDELPVELPDVVKLALFRIIQEALNNIAKHSGASELRLDIDTNGDNIRLVIEDDGAGFNPGRLGISNPNAGYGLLIMRERAEAIDADFRIDTGPGQGVKITVDYKD